MLKTTPKILITLAIIASAIIIPPVEEAKADVNVSVTWEDDNSLNCHKPGESSIIRGGVISWTANIKNHGPDAVFIEKAAFHDPVSGCGGTTHTLRQDVMSMTGEINYARGEYNQTTFSYIMNSFSCGRVQLDAAYRNTDGSYDGRVFLGEVIDYGVDCGSTTPPPSSCTENSVLAAPKIIPTSIAAGSVVPFDISITNSGETWFYHGSYFQLVQTTGLNITPPYGHLSPSLRPGEDQLKNFSLVAPNEPGTYTITFQMVHKAGADYLLPSGKVCAPAPTKDVYFGNALTMTFTVSPSASVKEGNVIVTSNIPTTWTIKGPQNFSGTGVYAKYRAHIGSYQITNMPAGIVSGTKYYELTSVTPSHTQSLGHDQTITFQATYVESVRLIAPRILLASNAQCSKISLKWEDRSDNENGFHIYRSEQEHNGDYTKYQKIATLPANTTTYVDRPEVNKSYYYIVAAYTISPAKVAASAAYRSDFNVPCTAMIDGDMRVYAINGQTNFDPNKIKDNDVVTIELLIDNRGPSTAYVTKVVNQLSPTLTNPRNLTVSGLNSIVGSPAISGTHPNYIFNVSGKKEVGGLKWVVRFDATLDLNYTAVTDQFGNCATIHYFDETGNKTSKVCMNNVMAKNETTPGLRFREVAP